MTVKCKHCRTPFRRGKKNIAMLTVGNQRAYVHQTCEVTELSRNAFGKNLSQLLEERM